MVSILHHTQLFQRLLPFEISTREEEVPVCSSPIGVDAHTAIRIPNIMVITHKFITKEIQLGVSKSMLFWGWVSRMSAFFFPPTGSKAVSIAWSCTPFYRRASRRSPAVKSKFSISHSSTKAQSRSKSFSSAGLDSRSFSSSAIFSNAASRPRLSRSSPRIFGSSRKSPS